MADNTQTWRIKTGNAQEIRIPKIFLEQAGLTNGELEIEARTGQIIVRPVRVARQGWEAQFAAMTSDEKASNDGEPLTLTAWENTEWEWV